MKGSVAITMTDQALNTSIKNLPNVNPNYLPTYDSNISEANAVKIKTACQSLMNLSNNTMTALNLNLSLDITNFSLGGE